MNESSRRSMDDSAQEKRELLARLLHQVLREGRSNLTPEQQRLWFLQKWDATVPLNIFLAFELIARFDPEKFQQALDILVARHDMLRASFVDVEGYPIGLVMPTARIEPEQIDLSQEVLTEQQACLAKLAQKHAQQTIPLQSVPLLRLLIVKLSPERQVLLLALPRIIADERSGQVLLEELGRMYDALLRGEVPLESEQQEAFAPVAAELLKAIEQHRLDEQRRRWRELLAGVRSSSLPGGRPRPPQKSYVGAHRALNLSSALTRELEQFAERQKLPLHELVLAAFEALLKLYTGADEIVLGWHVDDRKLPQQARLVGPLTNTLVLRTAFSPELSFQELLVRVHETCDEARTLGEVPFELLVQDIQPERDLSRTPFFQISFAERSAPRSLALSAVTLQPLALESGVARYDLTLFVEQSEEGLRLEAEFNTDLFEVATIEVLLEMWQSLLKQVVMASDRPLGILSLLSEPMMQQVLQDWNQTIRIWEGKHSLQERIFSHARLNPGAPALIAGSEVVTFAQLDERTEVLAQHLQFYGIVPEQLVAVCLERSVLAPVACLATFKAGGAYVPMDPAYPDERLAYILRDIRPLVVITQRSLRRRLEALLEMLESAGQARPVLLSLDEDPVDESVPDALHPVQVTKDSLAYVIYTSGSTGQPKGVMVSQGGLLNYVLWASGFYEVASGNGAPLASSLAFDLTVTSLFVPLVAGRAVTLLPEQHGAAEALGATLNQGHDYSLVKLTPTHLEILNLQPALQGTDNISRYFVIGGEQLYYTTLQPWRDRSGIRFVNEYGPTETVVGCCIYLVGEDDPVEGAVPIGRPIANTRLYVLDENMRPTPIGVSGELYIGGAGVARGYLGQPELTAERFVPDPFAAGQRLYKTGDLVRYRSDGVLEFLGRYDRQVKVNGYRIELGEIETMLLQAPEVTQAVVEVFPDGSSDGKLVAYIVAEDQTPELCKQVRHFLAEKLPSYMLPTWIVPLEQLPLTTNGKIDRAALPRPEQQTIEESSEARPGSQLEEEIAQVIAEILGVSKVPIDQSIFELGANSLVIARLSARLSDLYEINPSLHEMFQDPTVMGLASMVEHFQTANESEAIGEWAWQAERLGEESKLDPSITPEGLPTASYLAPKDVFLTGVTGYLGAFLLDVLLHRTGARVYCLVRASTPERAMRRLRENLQQYLLWNEEYSERIIPVCGDLSKPLLGLSPEAFANLAAMVEAIYHAGALVNFTYPYDALRLPNVQGTQEVLRLACHTVRKAVHYLSTLDVYLMTRTPRPFIEVDLPNRPLTVPDGYMRTKWISEKLITAARDRGLPVTIHRPGFLIGHTKTGASPTNNYLLVALKGFLALGKFPLLSDMLNIAPVDYAAEAIVRLASRPDSYGKQFHLWNLAPVPLSETYPWLRSFGYEFDAVPYNIALELAQKVSIDHPLYAILPLLDLDVEAEEQEGISLLPTVQETIDVELECANTLAGLRGSGIECPPVTEEMIHSCLAYLVRIGFLEAPRKSLASPITSIG